jgi:hypothetical protein
MMRRIVWKTVLTLPLICAISVLLYGEYRVRTGPYGYFAEKLGSADHKAALKAIETFFQSPRNLDQSLTFLMNARFDCYYLTTAQLMGLAPPLREQSDKSGIVGCHYWQGGWFTLPYNLIVNVPIGDEGFSAGVRIQRDP